MKTGIHPTVHTAMVTCNCGASFETLSTVEKIQTEICSKCHPFFTGEQKIVDSAQRVEKFHKRKALHTEMQDQLGHRSKKEKRAQRSKGTRVVKSDAKAALKAAKDALADL